MSSPKERIPVLPDEPKPRSVAREEGTTIPQLNSVHAEQHVETTKSSAEASDSFAHRQPPEKTQAAASVIKTDEYDCDLVREYEQTKGRCFLVLEDCSVEAAIHSIDEFLPIAQEEGKVVAFIRNGNYCWNCQLYCGQSLIRIAALSDNKTIVQVHRCSGCSVGTHMIRKKLFMFLKGSEDPSSSFFEAAKRVPFDFLECTAAMRKEFQDRCRSLLESTHRDRRELAKEALSGHTQETDSK